MTTDCTPAHEEAVRLVLAHQTMLKSCVRALIRDPELAKDTFSDLTLAILECWEQYDSTRPFEPWARGIARRLALTNLRNEARQPRLLDEEGLEVLVQEIGEIGGESRLELKKEALHGCVQQLPPRHQQLIWYRFFDDRSYPEISGMVGKTVASIYVIFHRMYKQLSICITQELSQL